MLCTIFKYDAPGRGRSLVFPVAGSPPEIERQLASEQFQSISCWDLDDKCHFVNRRTDVQLMMVALGHPGGLPVQVHLSRRLSVHVQLHEWFPGRGLRWWLGSLLDFPPPLDAEHGCAFTY